MQQLTNRKVFVGRCTENMTADDLHSYFSKYGEVVDVFIPKPFRAFSFVTFADPEIAQALCGEDHIVKGASVHVSSAAPKTYDKQEKGKPGFGQQGGYGNQGGGGWSQSSPNNRQSMQSQQGGGGQNQQPSSNQNMGMGNNPLQNMGLNIGAFPLNPAMVAAAQAALSQSPWGPLLGMNNQSQQNAPNSNSGGGGDANGQQSNQSNFGAVGGNASNPPPSNSGNGGNTNFLGGWSQNTDTAPNTQQSAWSHGTQQNKTPGWN